MTRVAAVLVAWLMLMTGALPASAQKRVALVIGNARYAVSPLANPANDAMAIAKTFDSLGFTTTTVIDATKSRMEQALAKLAADASGADIAAVFFAGHGTERDGRNYLIPVDAALARASDLDLQAISLTTVVDQLAGASKLRLVMLDACRNNVFPLAGNKRSSARGLARVEPDDNTLIAYAAKDGTTADDGASGASNSPFTSALLKHLPTPGLEITFVLREVRDDVIRSTGRQQQPYVYGSLGREAVYLRQGGLAASTAGSAKPPPEKLAAPSAVIALPKPMPAPPTSPPAARSQTWRVKQEVSKGIQNVRSGPGTTHDILFSIPAGAGGIERGSCRQPDSGGGSFNWCQVTWRGRKGWTSSNGLEPE